MWWEGSYLPTYFDVMGYIKIFVYKEDVANCREVWNRWSLQQCSARKHAGGKLTCSGIFLFERMMTPSAVHTGRLIEKKSNFIRCFNDTE